MLVGALCCLASCIENTIPYPVEKIDILTYEGVGFSSKIDAATNTVTLTLDEQTNISAVEVTNVEITEFGESSTPLTGMFNLKYPIKVVLSRFQEYEWLIRANQTFERYFNVEGQIGDAEIDEATRTATVYVSKGSDLTNIKVNSLKLGPKDVTKMTPAMEDLRDFSSVRYVYLQYPALGNEVERWQLYVRETDVKVQITQVDAWATIAWLYGAAQEGTTVGFRYRRTGDTEWIDAPRATVLSGTFSSKVVGLQPQTSYEFMAYSNEDSSPVIERTTEGVAQLVNSGFENWCVEKGIVYPYSVGESPYWGTGNVGSSIVGVTLTEGVEDIRPGSTGKLSARLASTYASVFGVGKFAAGNLFIGSYVRNDGTNGIVNFGRYFSSRPTALKGWLKYNCGVVDRVTNQPPGKTVKEGDSDCGMIFIALGDWDAATYGGTDESPVSIATRYIEETAFDPNSPAVIAYGEMPLTQSVGSWQEFTIPLEYRATNRIPTHIILVCSASRYGDYFTGSTQSVLWLDDFELLYE